MIRHRSIGLCLIFACLLPPAAWGEEKPGTKEVKVIDLNGVRRLITERHGKILFLNVWATWCQPCVEEFPDIVGIRNSVPDSIADVAAISVDYPDEAGTKVLPFLRSRKVTFPVYVSGVKKEEDFMNALNPSWSGGVPATFIFDKHGELRSFLFGQKTFDIFKAAIDSVISAQ